MISKEKIIREMWDLYNSYGNNANIFEVEQTEAINKFLSRFQKIIENLEVENV